MISHQHWTSTAAAAPVPGLPGLPTPMFAVPPFCAIEAAAAAATSNLVQQPAVDDPAAVGKRRKTSKYRGVASTENGLWRCRIRFGKQTVHLGRCVLGSCVSKSKLRHAKASVHSNKTQ